MTHKPAASADKDVSASQRPPAQAVSIATELVAGTADPTLDHYVRGLVDPKESTAVLAAKVLEEVANHKPELLAPHIERLVSALNAERPKIAQCSAHCLPILARVAPAKVAKHLKTLQGSFGTASEIARDGLVRTFVSLCLASVTYQKRLIDVFEQALREADPKTLVRWVELILPALKGEPYAQARAVAEQRLTEPELPRPVAQRVAELLGVKLRALPTDRK
ncbi:MAG TPA: hypothetical protein VJR89_10520 [Polyangiales bacterium]|nr:hypothetical protein [Polyangiales bacterium]